MSATDFAESVRESQRVPVEAICISAIAVGDIWRLLSQCAMTASRRESA
jgi:hypothetical protein